MNASNEPNWENKFIPPSPLTTEALLRNAATHVPDHVAVKERDQTRTFAELEARSGALARALYAKGIKQGDVVLLNQAIGIPLYESFLAVTRLGAVALHLHDLFLPEDVRLILEIVHPVLSIDRAFHQTDLPVASAEESMAAGEAVEAIWRAPSESDLATFIPTSGTTGRPKLIAVPHINIYRRVPRPNIHFQPGYRYGCPYSHAFPIYHVANTPFMGGVLIFRPAFSPAQIEKFIAEERLHYFFGLPALYEQVAKASSRPEADLSSLVGAVTASAYLSPASMAAVERRWGAPVFQFYGQNELGTLTFADRDAPKDSVGKCAYGVELRIVDETGDLLPPRKPGRIQARTAVPFGGYVTGEPSPIDAEGWFTTGDVGYLDEAGYLYLVGRETEIINVAGFKVSANEVAEVLRAMPGLKDVHVFPRPHRLRGETVAAVVVAEPGVKASDIKRHCRGRLSRFKQPTEIIFLLQLPRTPLGKIDKRALTALLLAQGGN